MDRDDTGCCLRESQVVTKEPEKDCTYSTRRFSFPPPPGSGWTISRLISIKRPLDLLTLETALYLDGANSELRSIYVGSKKDTLGKLIHDRVAAVSGAGCPRLDLWVYKDTIGTTGVIAPKRCI